MNTHQIKLAKVQLQRLKDRHAEPYVLRYVRHLEGELDKMRASEHVLADNLEPDHLEGVDAAIRSDARSLVAQLRDAVAKERASFKIAGAGRLIEALQTYINTLERQLTQIHEQQIDHYSL